MLASNALKCQRTEQGFTLIEVLVTMVIAMVILAGLLLNFTSQSSQYKYQDKRADAVQDLNHALQFVANDLEKSVLSVNSPIITVGGTDVYTVAFDRYSATSPTRYLSFYVWDFDNGTAPSYRALRCYTYRSDLNNASKWMIKYKRSVTSCNAGTSMSANDAILGEALVGLKGLKVTHFRVFQDGKNNADRAAYDGIPSPLPTLTVNDSGNNPNDVPGFTILIELEVDAVTKSASTQDVLGNTVTDGRRRIWRYAQVYPKAVVTD